MKGCVKHLTLCFLEEFSWPPSSCCLVPSQEKQPSEMSKDQEPALLDSSPGSTLRGQVIYSFHQLLLQSQCLSPLKQERHPGVPCQVQWRFQWKNVYEGSVGNAQCRQSWAKTTLTLAPVTTCGLDVATVPHTDHFKEYNWLHNPGSLPLDIHQEEWKRVSTKGLLYELSQQI